MAGVVVMPRQRNNYYGVLEQAGSDLLGGFLGNMFDRQRQAKAYELNKRTNQDNEALRVQARDSDFIHNSEKVMPYLTENYKIDRQDPNGNFWALSAADLFGADNAVNQFENVLPEMTSTNVDQGGYSENQIFDPGTGKMTTTRSEQTLDPNIGAQTEAQRYAAGAAAGASRYASDMAYKTQQMRGQQAMDNRQKQLITDNEGRYVWADPYGPGSLQSTDHFAPSPAAKAPGIVDLASAYESAGGVDPEGAPAQAIGQAIAQILGQGGQGGQAPAEAGPAPTRVIGQPQYKGNITAPGNPLAPWGAKEREAKMTALQQAGTELSDSQPMQAQGGSAGPAPNTPPLDLATFNVLFKEKGYSPQDIMAEYQKAGIAINPEVLNEMNMIMNGGY